MTLVEIDAWIDALGMTWVDRVRTLRLILAHRVQDQMTAEDYRICQDAHVLLTGAPWNGDQCSTKGCVHGAYLRHSSTRPGIVSRARRH